MSEIVIRDIDPDDVPFVYSSWLQSYRHGSKQAQKIRKSVYFAFQHKLIERILLRGAAVKVATPEDDTTTILGYVVAEHPEGLAVLHYLYVKEAFRSLGIAKKLLASARPEATPAVFTHSTVAGDVFARRIPGLSFNPYLT